MDVVNEIVFSLAGSPWVYGVLALVCVVDAFFPPVPSESVVVALASLAVSTGQPALWLVALVAAAAAILGDNIAYTIGSRIGTTRFRWMRRPRVMAAFDWARRGLDRRGAALVLTARYIPVGRIAVNMTAGATGYPRRRFVPLTVLAGTTWAVYSIAVGTLFGHWFAGHPLVGAGVAIVVAVAVGFVVDAVVQRLQARRDTRAAASSASSSGDGTARELQGA